VDTVGLDRRAASLAPLTAQVQRCQRLLKEIQTPLEAAQKAFEKLLGVEGSRGSQKSIVSPPTQTVSSRFKSFSLHSGFSSFAHPSDDLRWRGFNIVPLFA